MKPQEKKETPKYEAQQHPKKFLIAALRQKSPHSAQCGCAKCK